jgi:hypothetical protein
LIRQSEQRRPSFLKRKLQDQEQETLEDSRSSSINQGTQDRRSLGKLEPMISLQQEEQLEEGVHPLPCTKAKPEELVACMADSPPVNNLEPLEQGGPMFQVLINHKQLGLLGKQLQLFLEQGSQAQELELEHRFSQAPLALSDKELPTQPPPAHMLLLALINQSIGQGMDPPHPQPSQQDSLV